MKRVLLLLFAMLTIFMTTKTWATEQTTFPLTSGQTWINTTTNTKYTVSGTAGNLTLTASVADASVNGGTGTIADDAFTYADLNGLKRMNDDNGHSAGDKLIKDAAAILKEVFTEGEIYRAGGDEFMILLRDTNMAQLEDYEKQIKERADKTDTVSFAVGLCIEEDSQKIYNAMKAADVNMYEDKKKFYGGHPEFKRH